ncbi:MAG TPA: hypothetical protein VHG72_08625 [Polyangia bacterium]|nr:hypothetical protein [Polyangia bacterium]
MSLLVVFALACAQQDATKGTGTGGSGNSGSGGSASPGSGGAPGTGSGGRGASGGSAAVPGGSAGVQGQAGADGNASGGSGSGGSPAGGAKGSAGASGTAGASGEAGGNGSGGTTAASGCAGKTYKLCEDFESDTVGSLPTGWTKFQGYGVSSPQDQAVATDEFHSGSKSLKSISAAQGASRIQKSLVALGATANKHWGRIFYKVQDPSAVDNIHVLHTTFVSLTGDSTEDRVVDTVEAQGGHTHQWLMNTPDDKCCSSTGSDYGWTFDDSWHCAEWYVDLTTKSFRFFSDSIEVTQLAFANRASAEMPASYMAIVLGATYYQTDELSGPFVMWIDDLAIDDTQIHCQ